jgi:hypothetical protein
MRARTVVPWPGFDSRSKVPPKRVTRSRIPTRPSRLSRPSNACPVSNPHSVVLHDERHVIGSALNDDTHVSSAGMFGDIVQRFLDDAIECDVEFMSRGARFHPADVIARLPSATPPNQGQVDGRADPL